MAHCEASAIAERFARLRGSVVGENENCGSIKAHDCAPPFDVMAGLVPAIHAAPLQTTFEVGGGFWAWMPGTRPRLSGSIRRRHWRAELPPPLWGRAGEGGRANLTENGPLRGFGEVGATPLPNPPPQGGREFQRSIRPSNPCPQRCRSSQSSAICGLSKLRRFPQPDSRGTRPGMTCGGARRPINSRLILVQ